MGELRTRGVWLASSTAVNDENKYLKNEIEKRVNRSTRACVRLPQDEEKRGLYTVENKGSEA